MNEVIEYLERLVVKAEADADLMKARATVAGPDLAALQDRIIFHQGQASGLRHALFALRHGGEFL